MNDPFPRFSELFAQLGLDHDNASIARFIRSHAPLPGDMRLADAPFWTEAQARMLNQLCAQDADWSNVVDQLNAALHAEPA